MAKRKPARQQDDQALPVTPQTALVGLLNLQRRSKGKVSEINDEVREAVTNAVENKHLHRGAFNFVKRLYPMQDEKLAEFMYHLTAYLDSSGISDRVEKVGRLPLGDDDGKGGENVVELAAAE